LHELEYEIEEIERRIRNNIKAEVFGNLLVVKCGK